jgi:hypothetical protein
MALRAVFDRTPREAPKFLPLRGLVRPHLLLRVNNLIACLIADVARPPDAGRRRMPSTGRDRARLVALVGCGLTAALRVLRASLYCISVKTFLRDAANGWLQKC